MKDKYYLGLHIPVEQEKEHACKYLNKKTDEKYKELLLSLIDCVYDIQRNKELTQTHIDLLYKGITQSLELVFCNYSGKFISILSHDFIEAEQLLKRLADDKSSQVRFNSVTILLYKPIDSVTQYVIQKCISDKSSKVKRKVADVCHRLDLVNMISILEPQRLIEKDISVKASLDFTINLIKEGFVMQDNGTEKLNLFINLGAGNIKGITVQKKQLESFKIQEIVESVKEKNKLPWE